MNSAHGYTEGAEVPQQPQADKANEGREEARIDFLTREVLNHLGDGWIKGLIVRQDINNLVIEARALRDQLSKERENITVLRGLLNDVQNKIVMERINFDSDRKTFHEQLEKERELTQTKVNYYEDKLESMQRSLDMWYADLVKEREIRKELEGLMKNIVKYGRETEYYIPPSLLGTAEDLIAKATELDNHGGR